MAQQKLYHLPCLETLAIRRPSPKESDYEYRLALSRGR